ncbi:MAG TPA: diguanylate cyclase [Terriglobales bacterium]|jgi:diguanylate cyclase (GGDEF)-like protein|nr:diguanylate cyclase [Terriglobales bacterium]
MPDPSKRAEIVRRVAGAEKLLQRGKTEDALEEYLEILKEDPENDNVRQLSADLCLSLNRNGQAVRLLGELFERQMQTGDATRASLTYKKLSRYGNPTWKQKVRFGELLEPSNKKLAVGTYENALEDLGRGVQKEEALPVMKRLVALEPTQQNYLRLAELSSEVGDHQTAASSFLKVSQLAEAAGTPFASWVERAYTEDSSDVQIGLAYGKSLLSQGEVGAAIFILEPHVQSGDASLELRDTYTKALIAANRCVEAEPLLWQLFEQNPTRVQQVADLIGGLVDSGFDKEATALARKLEQFQRRRGERRSFTALMQDVVAKHEASPELLEFLSELYNSSNREVDYSQTLLKLFDLYVSLANYEKAGECLDRAAEVDPYEHGHAKRLEMLKGKIDEKRFRVIASRFTPISKQEPEPSSKPEEPTLGTAALQDLMLQAEILVQYGMRSKAIERLQRIQELFPREEQHNEDLQRLYIAAGMTPQRANSAQPAPAQATQASSSPIAAKTELPAQVPATDSGDMTSLTRVAEITRKLYHQNTADAVLRTAVAEIGSHWRVTRCIAAMRRPGLPPTAVQECTSDGVPAGSSASLATLVAVVQDLAIARGSLLITDAMVSPDLQNAKQALSELGAASLLALPLADGEDPVGILILIQGTARGWHSSDMVVLKTLSDQAVIALNNAGLRRLVKNLSVTDEKSGLLKRASYLDLLQAETRRAMQQGTSVTILLAQFGKAGAMIKEFGEAAVQSLMEQVGHLFASNIRSNDLAFRYGMTTIAIILGETPEKEALMAVEKLRKLLADVKLPGKDQQVNFSAGLAEAVVRQQYDAVDIVTEVINRAEQALDSAMTQGLGKVVCQAENLTAAAVA